MGKFQRISSVDFMQENFEQLSYSNVWKCELYCWTVFFPHIFPLPLQFPSTNKTVVLRHREFHSDAVFRWARHSCWGTVETGFSLVILSVLSGWNFLRTVPFLPTPSSVCLGSCQHVTCFCRVCVGIMLAGWVLLVLDAWPTLPYTFTRGHKCQIVLDHVHLPLTACGSNMEPTKSLSWHFWRVSLLFKSWWRKMPSHLLWLLIIF